MKTTMFTQPSIVACISLAFILILTSCDKRIRKNGSGVVTTSNRTLGDFDQIDADGSYEIYVHNSETPYVTITTDDNIVSEVHSFVQDGKLFIEMSDDYFNYDYTRMELHVYSNNLNKIDLNGSVDLTVMDTLPVETFVLNHNGDGRNVIRFQGNSISLSVNGSGRMEVIGESVNATYSINGSGKIDALECSLQNADVNIHGSGDVYVNCDVKLDGTIDGSGNIRYLGSPLVTSHINGSGSIAPY